MFDLTLKAQMPVVQTLLHFVRVSVVLTGLHSGKYLESTDVKEVPHESDSPEI